MTFEELGLHTVDSGDTVKHIKFGTSTAPVGVFARDLKTQLWLFSGTGWTHYNSHWLRALADKLDEMNNVIC